jgi:hypothetical protein
MPAQRILYVELAGREEDGGADLDEAEKSMDYKTVALTAAKGLKLSSLK